MSHFTCTITHEIMTDPVMTQDGNTYEREAITKWLSEHNTSPNTGEVIAKMLITNYTMRSELSAAGYSLKNVSDIKIVTMVKTVEESECDCHLCRNFRNNDNENRLVNFNAERPSAYSIFPRLFVAASQLTQLPSILGTDFEVATFSNRFDVRSIRIIPFPIRSDRRETQLVLYRSPIITQDRGNETETNNS